jgi:hypothetical protein
VDWTQGLAHARQALYYLSYVHKPFVSILFLKTVSC